MIPHKQLSLADIFSDCQEKFENDKPAFLSLLETHINIDEIIHDSKLLIPTLKDSFSKHPLINPKIFLGDAAFDATELYKSLLTGDTFGKDKHFFQFVYLLSIYSINLYQRFINIQNNLFICNINILHIITVNIFYTKSAL